jgi:hypothetical protein
MEGDASANFRDAGYKCLVVCSAAGVRLCHRLELAKAAAGTPMKAAGVGQDRDDIDGAELRQAGLVHELFFKTQARAAVGQGVAIDFAAQHVEVDGSVVAHPGVVNLPDLDAIDGFAGGTKTVGLLGARCRGGARGKQGKGHEA